MTLGLSLAMTFLINIIFKTLLRTAVEQRLKLCVLRNSDFLVVFVFEPLVKMRPIDWFLLLAKSSFQEPLSDMIFRFHRRSHE